MLSILIKETHFTSQPWYKEKLLQREKVNYFYKKVNLALNKPIITTFVTQI